MKRDVPIFAPQAYFKTRLAIFTGALGKARRAAKRWSSGDPLSLYAGKAKTQSEVDAHFSEALDALYEAERTGLLASDLKEKMAKRYVEARTLSEQHMDAR